MTPIDIAPADWPDFWANLSPEYRALVTRLIGKYADLMPSWFRTTTEPRPCWETFCEAMTWQDIECDVLDVHAAWLARTRAMFERRGWPWTTTELAARAHVREVGE